ncbi:MAG: hypothetical protein AAFR61_28190 [Bacteroidota bacterium]
MDELSNMFPERVAIPPVFYHTESEAPFSHCVLCERELLESNTSYLVEKACKYHPETGNTDVKFEYAICWECAGDMDAVMSDESRDAMMEYLIQHVNLLERRERLLTDHGLVSEKWIDHCMFKGSTLEANEHFQLIGHFKGKQMVFSLMPYMVGEEAMKEMSLLLSSKTLGEMNRFFDQFFGLPPELKDLFKDRPPILL